MIVDCLENYRLYRPLGDRLAKALDYLHQTDLSALTVGEHAVEGRDVFAIVNDYNLRPLTTGRLEAHRRYIDIQYLARGSEAIGYAPLSGQHTTTDYDAEGDFVFYPGESSLVLIKQGMFAIFFPHDLHMPGIGDTAENVRKVVMKVRI